MKKEKHLERLLPLYLYGELTGKEKEELEVHLKYCEQCSQALQEMKAFHGLLARQELAQPSPDALNAARGRLRERLRQERQRTTVRTLLTRFGRLAQAPRMAAQIAVALVLFLLGLFVGQQANTGPGRLLESEGAGLSRSPEALRPFISDVDLIQYDPKTREVTVRFRTLSEVALQGRPEDPMIRRVLAHAIRTENNPGYRLTAVKASSTARASADPELEDALIYAVERDTVPGVRLRAARVLRGMPMSDKIKRAFIRVLLKDENPALRMEALSALGNLDETDVVPILQDASRDDENAFVRLEAAKALERREKKGVEREADTP
ncbi:MAG: hypothetical protein D6743_00905 [Calditrichaeota bacterium]|nr:MAG: hypothetical protein D6743_00905 [Calditrichota bacterium]